MSRFFFNAEYVSMEPLKKLHSSHFQVMPMTAHIHQPHILVIEDDPDIAQVIQLHLAEDYPKLSIANNGREGYEKALEKNWDLIVLDLRLPEKDGLEICRDLRGQGNFVPILMLTSRSSELDRVLGLEMGADDYLTKPFSLIELSARIKALLRRSMREPVNTAQSKTIALQNLTIDSRTRTAEKNGHAIELTAKEFDLLWFFMSQPEQVFSRNDLLEKVWGYGHQGYEHTVNSHINRLRAKVEDDPANPNRIMTVWGVGYKFNTQ